MKTGNKEKKFELVEVILNNMFKGMKGIKVHLTLQNIRNEIF